MSHLPECESETAYDVCVCDLLRAAYERGCSESIARTPEAVAP